MTYIVLDSKNVFSVLDVVLCGTECFRQSSHGDIILHVCVRECPCVCVCMCINECVHVCGCMGKGVCVCMYM